MMRKTAVALGSFDGLHRGHMSVIACTADFKREKISGYGETRMALLKKHRMPFWFQLANLFYPLVRILLHPRSAAYFFAMFCGRLSGWLHS